MFYGYITELLIIFVLANNNENIIDRSSGLVSTRIITFPVNASG